MTYGLPDSAILGTAKRLMGGLGVGGSYRGKLGTTYAYKFKDIVFREAALELFLNEPRGAVGRYLNKRGLLIMAAAKRQVGVKTGALRASIRLMHDRDALGQKIKIGSSLPHAYIHHQGTKPHLITPKDTGLIRFSSKGRVVYSRQIMHPGTKPNKYLSDQLWIVKAM
jgi:hypothetical protein